MDILQNTLPLCFRDIDRSDRLTLAATFDYFQEAAISHAENLGVGRESMAQTGQIWILSRMSVLMERRPKFRETVTVRSWPRGWEKLFALRDYDIRDASDTPVVRGRSCWLIIDREKRRPLRPQAVMENLPRNDGLDALSSGAAALEGRDNLLKAVERKALYSDVDYNGHVNNTRYIQWIQDAIQPELLENAGKMRLDINYLNEIRPGETTEILYASLGEPGVFAFEGRKPGGDAGQAAFRAELRLWPEPGRI
ncbi:MAG: acyl-ACP thioesterase [Treponema sp.]|nr:acyl-ACP thioesterase [Treponema sp.]